MKPLNEILIDHKSLEQLLLERDGEITDLEHERILMQWMYEITEAIEKKVDNYEYRRQDLLRNIESAKNHEEVFKRTRKTLERLCEALKDRMMDNMIQNDLSVLEGDKFMFKLQQSPPSVVIDNASLIPKDLVTEEIVITPDKKAIKDKMAEGLEVPGCHIERGFTLKSYGKK